MKFFLIFVFVITCFNCFSQQEEFELEGRITDSTLIPVADAYIINMRTQEKSVSQKNGVFNVKVLPTDSIAILHVSFNRKFVRVFDLMKNPVIQLETDNRNIGQVDVSANQKSDYQKVNENISSITETKFYEAPKIEPEPEPAMQLMIEHNKVLRSEATSLRILRFSPSEKIGKLFQKLKKKKKRKRETSTKK